jgi:hypothetical protein
MADFTSNLELYFGFDEGTGTTTADLSGNSRNGTLTNSPTWGTGKIRGGLTFVGSSSQYVATSYAGITGTGARTVAFWAKTTDTNTDTKADPVINWGSTATGGQWLVAIQNGVLWERSVGVTASFGSGLNDGNWHHIAVTMPSGGLCNQIKGYIDGVSQSGTYTGGTTAINTGTTYPLNVCTQPANIVYFNGSVDEMRVYSRELTSTDVAALAAWGGGSLAAQIYYRRILSGL